MDHECITPFITNARIVFSTMMQPDPAPRAPTIEETGGTRSRGWSRWMAA